ncbi:glycerate kinase [Paracandidimonas soli]|uniref:Glycerate kinase n=1 Tax=Paracandidimonas soli TaxID=1917182 RepID=A0A4R3V955_9BURK|nr:glycerate kinase [Paracandidimonas soli]TCV01737.1 glycerate kinase [Paracandidimonas soli]
MRVVIAPDSFKESLSASGVAQAIAEGIKAACPEAETICIPMADGGEGSLDAVLAATGGERRAARVRNANGQEVDAAWGWLGNGRAFVEMATAAGLEQIAPKDRRVLDASSFGVGQLIAEALRAGATHIIMGLGGSASNDAGAGLIQALGVRLLDAEGRDLASGGAALAGLHRIDTSGVDPRLAQARFELAVDVDNPLCGERGASAIFGPQKGASAADVAQLDAALAHFADILQAHTGLDFRDMPGMGAAGGIGLPMKALFDATFQPGIELVAALSGLDEVLDGADLVITGEGRMDRQTLLGKTPAGVARHAAAKRIPVIAIAGSLGDGYEALYEAGITASFSIAPGPVALEDACRNAAQYLRQRSRAVMQVWMAAQSIGKSA